MRALLILLILLPNIVPAQLLQKKEISKVAGHYWDLEGNKHVGSIEILHTKSAGVGTKSQVLY